MMRFISLSMWLLLLISMSVLSSVAQDDDVCPTFVDIALEMAASSCDRLDQNRACYGNTFASVESRSREAVIFDTPGDLITLDDILTLRTGPLDLDAGEWGIAFMTLQGSFLNAEPEPTVTFLLLGDTTITDVSENEPDFGFMQAFQLETGLDIPECEATPNNLLIQTPSGTQVTLSINGVKINLTSTAVLSAVPGESMDVLIVGGEGEITAVDETQYITAGQETTIMLNGDDGFIPISPPTPPEDYAPSRIQGIPFQLLPEDLDEINANRPNESACMVSADNINERSGPGTHYSIEGTLSAGESVNVNGQATGIDGYVWWKLSDGLWVRSDVVNEAGACANTPIVETPEPPPPSSPSPSNIVDDSDLTRVDYCIDICFLHLMGTGTPVSGPFAGQNIHLHSGISDVPDLVNQTATILVNGVAVNVRHGGHYSEEPDGLVNVARSDDWTNVAPGTYTVSVSWSTGYSNTCTLIVEMREE